MAYIFADEAGIHSVVLEKRKAEPRITADENYFYSLAWHSLFGWMSKKTFAEAEGCTRSCEHAWHEKETKGF